MAEEEIKKTTKAAPKTTTTKEAPKTTTTKKVATPKEETPKTTTKKAAAPKEEVKEEAKKAPAKKAAPKEETPVVEEAKKVPTKKAAPKEETPVVEAPIEEKVEEAPKASAKKSPAKKVETKNEVYVPRVKVQFEQEVKPALLEKYHYSSVMQIPQLVKIVINWGVGDAVQDNKRLEDAVNELTLIAGQKPVVTRAKKSISSFKLRAGQAIGCKVTLRGQRMYEFYDKLVSIALPRVRDFRGVSKNAFDGRGNYTLGVREQLIFPEIDYDKVHKVRGMDIVIVTSAKTDEEAYTLLSLLGMPFSR